MVENLNNSETSESRAWEERVLLEETRRAVRDIQSEKISAKKKSKESVEDKEPTVDEAIRWIYYLDVADGTFEGIMSKNDSKRTMKAIQVLLKDRGYDVWSIDGILKTASKKTSKTMEAIKRFQQDNGIKPVDGIPWLKTLDCLVKHEKVAIPFGPWEITLPFAKSITDKQAEELWKLNEVSLDSLESITDKQAEYLSKVNVLSLNWLKSITDKQAKILSKVAWLELNWLTHITDRQAEYLSKVGGLHGRLELNWLTSITDKQTEHLSKVMDLRLDWLTSITDKQAEYLSKGYFLSLNWLKSITDKQSECLSKLRIVSLNWLTRITDEQAVRFWKNKNLSLSLDWLKSITDKQALELVKLKRLHINRDILTPKQKEILKK